MKDTNVVVDVSADTTQFDSAMSALNDSTKDFGRVFSSTISRAITSGKSFEDTLRSIGQRFADLALNQALKPLENIFGNVLGALVGSLGGGTAIPAFAQGGVFQNQSVVPFANGGIVSSPTPFNFGQRLGVMGEAGPEAIMPLKRGSDGKLGVAAGGSAGNSMNVVFNVTSNDASSFKRSEGQITAMLARAVSRGQRNL
jgi:lambda family phage tail tape measure protein